MDKVSERAWSGESEDERLKDESRKEIATSWRHLMASGRRFEGGWRSSYSGNQD